ncbi:MAG: hypothetical protein Q4F24_08055 [Eubacteriales bacterium]|nr:hypothetical protein [Eubacteriales bacterium]
MSGLLKRLRALHFLEGDSGVVKPRKRNLYSGIEIAAFLACGQELIIVEQYRETQLRSTNNAVAGLVQESDVEVIPGG